MVETDDFSTSLLVLGQNRGGGSSDEDLHKIRKIFDRAFCDSIILRLGNRRVEESDQVLVPTSGGPHSQVALKLASRLAKRHNGEIVPLFIESEIGEEDGKAIILGFLAALIFGTLVGFAGPLSALTSELAARAAPNLLDFGVAAMSGIAASYCIARPSLSSALAGVAIAAALVPPIATVGISRALHEWASASGAALLFSTNVVAIILASAVTFFAIGIRGQAGIRTLWTRRTLVFLLAALGILLVPLIR